MASKIEDLLDTVHGCLTQAGVDHALIGAFALGALGIERATNDIDLLIDGARVDSARQALAHAGFTVFHSSDDVLQLAGPGPVDLILARRPLSLGMLARARRTGVAEIRSVVAEDLIGLKIQAYCNDPRRRYRDLADIQRLIEHVPTLDWRRIREYADLFSEWATIEEIRELARGEGR